MRRAGAGLALRLNLGLAATLAVALLAPLPAAHPEVVLTDTTAPLLSPFDLWDPAVGRLEPALLRAVQDAADAAAAQGITMTINSGWRSPQFQQSSSQAMSASCSAQPRSRCQSRGPTTRPRAAGSAQRRLCERP